MQLTQRFLDGKLVTDLITVSI